MTRGGAHLRGLRARTRGQLNLEETSKRWERRVQFDRAWGRTLALPHQ